MLVSDCAVTFPRECRGTDSIERKKGPLFSRTVVSARALLEPGTGGAPPGTRRRGGLWRPSEVRLRRRALLRSWLPSLELLERVSMLPAPVLRAPRLVIRTAYGGACE